MADKPNILIIWGDDIGITNLSCYSDGLMGYRTPNIDRVAEEGVRFTDYYGEQSCTAGRAAFITGQNPYRTGLTKVGFPGADIGLRGEDPTIATALKAEGYATGQFGKNHFGDRDEFLPTAHGFDEFFGNLYHLNAEEEPEQADYPNEEDFPEFRKRFGPRGVIKSWANPDGTQRIEDTGRGWASSVPVVRSYLAAAWGAWEEMDLPAAERWVGLAAGTDATAEPPITTSIRMLEAHIRYSRTGDSRELAGRLRAAWEIDGAEAGAPAAIGHYCLADLRVALSTADKGWADGIIARARRLLGDEAGDVLALEAMVDAHQGRGATARRRLSTVFDGRRPCRATAIEIASWLLEADLTAGTGPTRAHHAVVRALDLAAPLHAVRQVATAPPRVRELLLHGRGRFGHHDEFVGEVLARSRHAEDAPDDFPGFQTLTARELDVLRDLQSLQSVDEIAESQAVSVNTVKTHLKALYRKFEVGNRREAVERGRELGLL